MSDVPKELQEKINRLSMMEQSLQQFLQKKQTFQSQLVEIESALGELEKTEKAYRIVGNVMVSADKKELTTDLTSKKETINLRIKTLEKQEDKLRKETSDLQSEVMKAMAE
ncbi:TPA: prefoldin subunit beta [Candidatus Woesearchaeota archaeon]|nr:prefoldin subunit beta [Candidatus Woesearchaeota archaeon]